MSLLGGGDGVRKGEGRERKKEAGRGRDRGKEGIRGGRWKGLVLPLLSLYHPTGRIT